MCRRVGDTGEKKTKTRIGQDRGEGSARGRESGWVKRVREEKTKEKG